VTRERHTHRPWEQPVRAARRRAPETPARTNRLPRGTPPPVLSAATRGRCVGQDTNMRIAPLWRSAASVLLGYLVIVVCTTIGFRPLGGIVHRDAPLTLQAAGALVAVVSGLLGGVMAALVAGRRQGSGVVRARRQRHAHVGHSRWWGGVFARQSGPTPAALTLTLRLGRATVTSFPGRRRAAPSVGRPAWRRAFSPPCG